MMYNILCDSLKFLRDYNKLNPSVELFQLIYKIDAKLKEIDKSIGTWSDGGNGNYKPKSFFKR